MKTCARCTTAKPSADFSADATRKDGLAFYCRDCRREQRTGAQPRDREQQRAKKREYNRVRRLDPAVKARERARLQAWRLANPEKYRASIARNSARRRGDAPESSESNA